MGSYKISLQVPSNKVQGFRGSSLGWCVSGLEVHGWVFKIQDLLVSRAGGCGVLRLMI